MDSTPAVQGGSELAQWRKQLRMELRERRAALPEASRRERGEAITRFLLEGFPQLGGMTIGFYWPFGGEYDPRVAVLRMREAGARAALPVVIRKAAPLEFREWWPGIATSKGPFDLPVPEGSSVVIPGACLIPPVGFDKRGYRLGYGGGFFDRTLASLDPQPIKIAVAFEVSRIETIRPQPYDIPMDFVVTEEGIHRVGAAGLERVKP